VSRSHHVPLERTETTVHGGTASRLARRRAALEEELLTALAAGDRERVSELRCVLAGLGIRPGRRVQGEAGVG
jgi:hypothetical protein